MAGAIEYDGSIEYEGRTYAYSRKAANSMAVARLVYGSKDDPSGYMDAFEALFGSYADSYWSEMGSDEKAFGLLAEVYTSERGLKN